MNYSVTMEVLHSCAELIKIALYLKFMKSFPSSQEFIEGLIVAKFKQDVDIFSIFEKMLKTHNVVVMQTSVDLDLAHELLLGTTLC